MEGEDYFYFYFYIFRFKKAKKKARKFFIEFNPQHQSIQHPASKNIFTSWKQRAHTSILHCLEKEEDVVRAEEYTNHRRGWLYRLPRGHSLRKEVPALQGESLYRLKSGADV